MNRNDARSLSEETIYELRCRAVDLKREGCTYEEVSVVLTRIFRKKSIVDMLNC